MARCVIIFRLAFAPRITSLGDDLEYLDWGRDGVPWCVVGRRCRTGRGKGEHVWNLELGGLTARFEDGGKLVVWAPPRSTALGRTRNARSAVLRTFAPRRLFSFAPMGMSPKVI